MDPLASSTLHASIDLALVSVLLLPPNPPSLPPRSPPLKCGGGNAEGAVLSTQPQQAQKRASGLQTRTGPKRERFSPSPCTYQTCLLSWTKTATWASLTCPRLTSCLRASNTSCPSSHHLLCPASSSSSSFCCLPLSLYPTHLHSPSRWHCASAIWSPRLRHSTPRLATAFRTVQMTRCVYVFGHSGWHHVASCLFILIFVSPVIFMFPITLHVPDLHVKSRPLWNIKLHLHYPGLKIGTCPSDFYLFFRSLYINSAQSMGSPWHQTPPRKPRQCKDLILGAWRKITCTLIYFVKFWFPCDQAI